MRGREKQRENRRTEREEERSRERDRTCIDQSITLNPSQVVRYAKSNLIKHIH